MPPDSTPAPRLELAHVLFMDIVGYSRKPTDAQRELLEQLHTLLRSLPELREAEAEGELLRLPTGDGIALVFFRFPETPARCALALARLLRQVPVIELRMGMHTGAVYRVADINANTNVSGEGINVAQRVMDCGDSGHILISRAMADVLRQHSVWEPALHDLGEHEAKHGLRLRLYNLVTPDAGNPLAPSGLRQAAPTELSAPNGGAEAVPAAAGGETAGAALRGGGPVGLRVALLYKRHAQPDERLLQMLEKALRARGHSVFIDRHLPLGIEWAREIERQVRGADAVVPLISAAALPSEMLAYEIQLVHEERQRKDGCPRLLPVRVEYDGPLPEALAAILDPLEYFLWNSPDDDEKLVGEIERAIRRPEREPPARTLLTQAHELEAVGGAVPLGSRLYVERGTDPFFHDALQRGDSIVLVKGARQMGKTSLLARGLQKAREGGSRVVLTDFQRMSTRHLESVEAFFLALGQSLADQLDLDVVPDREAFEVWGPTVTFERFLRREVLRRLETRLLWGMDEVDRLFSCSFGSEVFGLFRSWHNARALDPDGPWSRLTLAMAYATEAHLFITDVNQSPFNVGTRIGLEDFTLEQVADLDQRHGGLLRTAEALARFYELVGGHPYLVRRGFQEITLRGLTMERFTAVAAREDGPFSDHLRRILVLLAGDERLLDAVRNALCGRPLPDLESFYRLTSAGILTGDSARSARPRCLLYSEFLSRQLL